MAQYNYDDHWQEIDVELDRVKIEPHQFGEILSFHFSHKESAWVFRLLEATTRLALVIRLRLSSRELLKVVLPIEING